jgi:CheY-like chemotaxis protein
VRDSGVGIAPEMLPHVFDLFTQLERSDERADGGLGIGLALVRRLVELHGGHIAARSAGLGQGSEFEVRLRAARSGPPAPAGTPASASAAPPCHVLIIEDNADGRETLQTLLHLQGHRVETAADGPRGVELVLSSRPQVALVDLGLPGLDGFEVARQVRAVLRDEVFLIALTGFGQEDDRRRTLEAGFDAHLVKPVDLDALTRLLAVVAGPR